MPRFVILEHDHPFLHWDLMLECGEVLRTWRLTAAPAPGLCVSAKAIGDHRRAYLDYEGPVSGNRGKVMRWEWGEYAGELPAEIDAGEQVEIELRGGKHQGRARLQHVTANEWTFQWPNAEQGGHNEAQLR